GIDRGARAAERKERDGETRILHGKRQRGAHLIAVQRAVTGAAEPTRAAQRPVAGAAVLARGRAGLVAPEFRASRPVIFPAAEALETKALIRQLHRLVRVAFAGSNRISHAGDEHVAHLDLAHQPQRGAVREADVDACDRRPRADEAGLDLLVAGALDLPRMAVPVVEAPDAAFIGGQIFREPDPPPAIPRPAIDFPP